MKNYEAQLTIYNSGAGGVQQSQLQAMYLSICERKQELAQRRHEMLMGKKRMRANETALEQHNILAALSRRTSAAVGGSNANNNNNSDAPGGGGGDAVGGGGSAAGSGSKNPDEELLLELAEKRRALAQQLEEDKKNLELRKGALGSAREYELELELIQANSDKKSIQLEAAYLHKIHARAVSSVRREFKQQQRSDQRHSLHMLREMCECFEDERRAMKARHDEFAESLTLAIADIKALTQENERLRTQLRKATATGTN